jgi:signal transduction histidine kinase
MDREAAKFLATCEAGGASLQITHLASASGWKQGATKAMNRDVERSPNAVDSGAARVTERIRSWLRRPNQKHLNWELNLRREERLRERARIARELHDTMFQGFLGASMQLHQAVEEVPADSPTRASLCRALNLMQRVIDEGREVLQGLRSCAIASMSLEQALSGVRDEYTTKGVGFRIFVTGRPEVLKPAIQEQIYLIGREALVNALRHSEATSIEAEVEYLPRRVRLVVRDNGCGMDPKVVRSGRDSHWGLRGMRERADSIGAKLRIMSRPGAGTEVEVSVAADIVAAACA